MHIAATLLALSLVGAGAYLVVVPGSPTPIAEEDWDVIVGLLVLISLVTVTFFVFAAMV